MRIGCCLPGSNVMPKKENGEYALHEVLLYGDKLIMDAGFDYSESGVGTVLSLTEEEVKILNEKKAEGLFHLESCNCFIPGSLPICAGEKRAELKEYVEKAMKRMNELGIKVVVFGSGGARKIPEGLDRAKAEDEIASFLTMCNEFAVKYDVTVVIEPLNKGETNVLNSVSEGGKMAKRVDLPGIKLLADSFHMFIENEGMEAIEENKDILKHTHIADVPGRCCPGTIAAEQLKDFAVALKKAGYTERVTAECGFKDFCEEVGIAGKFMREQFC